MPMVPSESAASLYTSASASLSGFCGSVHITLRVYCRRVFHESSYIAPALAQSLYRLQTPGCAPSRLQRHRSPWLSVRSCLPTETERTIAPFAAQKADQRARLHLDDRSYLVLLALKSLARCQPFQYFLAERFLGGFVQHAIIHADGLGQICKCNYGPVNHRLPEFLHHVQHQRRFTRPAHMQVAGNRFQA